MTRPDSKLVVPTANKFPVDISEFRISANITADQRPDSDLRKRILNSVNIVEHLTGFSIIRGDYTCTWESDAIPTTPKFISDEPAVFPGFHASLNTFQYLDDKNSWITVDSDDFSESQQSEMGSLKVFPKDGRWSNYSGIQKIRLIGTAGCDDENPIPGIFFESLALVFRDFYYGEPESMDAAKRMLNRWIGAGSLL